MLGLFMKIMFESGDNISNWILSDGAWNDSKIWIDEEIWND